MASQIGYLGIPNASKKWTYEELELVSDNFAISYFFEGRFDKGLKI